jgi:hypothetical protein
LANAQFVRELGLDDLKTSELTQAVTNSLADWAEKDRDALTCQLNSYLGQKKEGVA